MQVINGLHQIKTSMVRPHLPYVMSYVFEDNNGGITLFDTGFGTDKATSDLEKGLNEIGYSINDIDNIIISHAHPDHIGMIDRIRKKNKHFILIMSKIEFEWVNSRKSRNWQAIGNAWLAKHGMSLVEIDSSEQDSQWKNIEWPQLKEAAVINDADTMQYGPWSFEFIHTPGHTIGHICLYEKNNKLLLTGDHVLPHISPNVSVDFEGKNSDALIQYMNSLKKVLNFETNIVLPAHEFAFKNLSERVNELLQHHKDRLTEHMNSFSSTPMTAVEVARKVSWNTGDFDNFNLMMKRSAVGETVAHLELLVFNNQLAKINGGHKEVIWTLT
jgi:glyoxylase-like metal-dependent hydrolase (beta-lactamase superfamily II)|tara:strand:+ start:381 stop:1367 length:987 start_codon:yes stop_codon:yes gene_type:complete